MTVRELAEYVLNHDIDEAVAKCEEILNEEEEEEHEKRPTKTFRKPTYAEQKEMMRR